MTNVNVTKTINASASEVWLTISSFKGIEQFSPVARSITNGNGVGATRSCFLPDDSEIKEELTKLNNEEMHLEYVIHSGPFPIKDYVSNVTVKAQSENSCEVSWSSKFTVDGASESDMIPVFEGFYNAIMEGLETLLQKA